MPKTRGRLGTFAIPLLAFLALACAMLGLDTAHRADTVRAAESHAALQAALADLGPVRDGIRTFDAATLRRIETRTNLHGLRFDTDLADAHGRDVQSVHDAQGRIVGWLSWTPERRIIVLMERLWSFAIALSAALYITGVVAARHGSRLRFRLRRSEQRLQLLSATDSVTGLSSRRALLERLDAMLARRGSRCIVLALIDIDGFRAVNDALGRAGGDAMLRAIASRFAAVLPEGGALGRFDDDEFAAALPADDAQAADALVAALAAALAAPFAMDRTWRIAACIGTALAPQDGVTADELQRRATLALRDAKARGRGSIRHFMPQIQEQHAERRFYLSELERAIAQSALHVHYQPIVAADGGRVVGVEALLRWPHPTRGLIGPEVFIPLAEENGLMIALGDFVLRQALRDATRWPEVFVSVNLSPVQMRSTGLVDAVAAALATSKLSPARLVLEVTESILLDDPQATRTTLQALRALGLSTALDDFGTGYSSLSYLQRFPFDRLKIDRSFVASLGSAGNAGAIIQSIVTLGHALGMKVLAEGIETDEQRVLLRLAGCDELQGYLFAKPAPAEAIDRLLRGSGRATLRAADAAS